jgi:hypothetical protein
MPKTRPLSNAQIRCLEHASSDGIARDSKGLKTQIGLSGITAHQCLSSLKKMDFLKEDDTITDAGQQALAEAQARRLLETATAQ